MKLTCQQRDLSRALSVVHHAISSRSSLPLLQHVLIAADDQGIHLTASNLELWVTCHIEATVEEPGTTTLPAKLFADLVSGLPQAPVELTLASSEEATHPAMRIRGLRSSATIKGLAPDEFPLGPKVQADDLALVLTAEQLKTLIRSVAFAAATDDSRPVFASVLIRADQEREHLIMAAADAFRLAERVAPLSALSTLESDLLIPARTLMELGKMLPSADEEEVKVSVSKQQNLVVFRTKGLEIASRLVEGTYPAYRSIIPTTHTTRVVVDAKEFRAALKSVVPFANESSNIVRVTIIPGGNDGLEPGTLTLEATAEDVGQTVSTIAAAVEGPGLRVLFNVKYLSDVLAVVDMPELALELTTAERPVVMRAVGDREVVSVVMPLSTNKTQQGQPATPATQPQPQEGQSRQEGDAA